MKNKREQNFGHIISKGNFDNRDVSKFNIQWFRRFQYISVLAIVLILVVACCGLWFILVDFAVHAAEHTAEHVSSALYNNEIRGFIKPESTEQPLYIPQEQLPELDKRMRQFLVFFNIVKIKIYDIDGRIIYSTDPKIIGKLDVDNTELVKALNGSVLSGHKSKDNIWDLASEQRYDVEIVETYVPIHTSEGRIVGCFEIYKDITEHLIMAKRTLFYAGGVFLFTVLVVFAMLMFVIHRALCAIKSRTAKLIAVNKQLHKEITEHKMAEEEKEQLQTQLHQTQKMEAIGTLAGGIAHDFNNILAALTGYIDMALEDSPRGSMARANLEQSLICCNRATELVKQILTFSRKTEELQKPTVIAPIVKEALKMLRSSLPTTIELRQSIEASSSTIMANPTQIHQILVNLCTNASHAMDEKGGVLEVSLTDVELKSGTTVDNVYLKEGSYLRLRVSDTGCGISSEIMERIFEPFFTTKKVDKGTGMGLSVVHGIIESHSGKIAVNSTLGKGTTFNVFFPRIESDQIQEIEPLEVVSGQGELILLVDDEKVMVDMTKQMLERLGYTVVDKTSSIDALKAFRAESGKFNLVITDLTMPNMTGVQLAKEIISIRPDIPVILCTGTGFSEDIGPEEAKSMGIKEFVTKPFTREKMAVIIRNVLDKKEATV